MVSALRVLWAWVSASPHSLCHSCGRALTRSSSMGSSALSLFLARQSPESCLSRQVSRWSQTPPPQQEATVCGPGYDSRRSTTVCKTTPPAPSSRLGGLRQACFRRSHAGVALSGSLHPSRSDFQSSLVSLRSGTRHFPLEGLRPRWQAWQDDSGASEFLRRFFLHVLPKGFVRIRHFGFLANRLRASRLALGRQLLTSNRSTPEEVTAHEFRSESSSLWHCPRCGTSMMVIQRFTAAELSACTYFDSS